jgi:excisionase family DNA binding protein
MAVRHHNYRRVKIHRNYTVEEIASLFGVHRNTVRAWVKIGMRTSDDRRPTLIRGTDLSDFLHARRAKNKQPCNPGEFYCVRCRAPKVPAGDLVEYTPFTEKSGNLQAICPDCESIMNRRTSLAKLMDGHGKIENTVKQALLRLSNSAQPTENSDLEQEA